MARSSSDDSIDRLLSRSLSVPAASGDVCPDVDLLAAFVDGELPAGERALVETHLSSCARCVELVAISAAAEPAVPAAEASPWWQFAWWKWATPLAAVSIAFGVWMVTRPDVRYDGEMAAGPASSRATQDLRTERPGNDGPIPPGDPAASRESQGGGPTELREARQAPEERGEPRAKALAKRQDAPASSDPSTKALEQRPAPPSLELSGRGDSSVANSASAPSAAPPTALPPPAAAAAAGQSESVPAPASPFAAPAQEQAAGAAADTPDNAARATQGRGGAGRAGAGRGGAQGAAGRGGAGRGGTAPGDAVQGGAGGGTAGGAAAAAGDVVRATALVSWRAIGPVIERSIDGGSTWTPEYTAISPVRGGTAVSIEIAWFFTGDGIVLRRTASGWTSSAIGGGIGIGSISATSATQAVVTLVDGRELRTSDAGATWSL